MKGVIKMRKFLTLTLVMVIVVSSLITASASEVVDVEDRVKYGVHIDSNMEVYENLETGFYRAEINNGSGNELGSVRSMKGEEIVGIIFGKSYIEITENDSTIVAENMTLTKVFEVSKKTKEVLTTGTYVVGQEIAPGLYKVENLTDTDGILQIFNHLRLNNEGKLGEVEIVRAGETIEFKVDEGQYAVNLFNVRMTRVE